MVDVRSECVETNAKKGQALEDQRRASVARAVLVCAPKLSIQKPAGYSPPINLKMEYRKIYQGICRRRNINNIRNNEGNAAAVRAVPNADSASR